MEVSELLDVLHYYYEEDMVAVGVEQAEARNTLRVSMYPLLYNTEYQYARKESQTGYSDDNPYLPPEEGEIKPYIPPTSPEELQAMLGPAMGE